MTDEGGRSTERASGLDPEARASWITNQIRAGKLSTDMVDVMAYAGDAGAALLQPQVIDDDIVGFLLVLGGRYGPKPFVVALSHVVHEAICQLTSPKIGYFRAAEFFRAVEPLTILADAPSVTYEDVQEALMPTAIEIGRFFINSEQAMSALRKLDQETMVEVAKQALIEWATKETQS